MIAYIGARLDHLLGLAIFRRLLLLAPPYTELANPNAQIARLRDFELVREFFTGPLATTLAEMPFVILFLVVMGILGGSLVAVPAGALVVFLLVGYPAAFSLGAVGLIFGLMFHFVIPISTYSWYMDFSSLVLALYMLSIPREVSTAFFERVARIFRASRERFGSLGLVLPFAIVGAIVALIVVAIAIRAARVEQLFQLYMSVWVLFWAVYGGIAMVLLTAVALDYLPWRGHVGPRQPLWLYAFPLVLFLTCLSPYLGLKTESSIAMFSNLHTEGGETNHLMFSSPPYLFDYQRDVVEVLDASSPALQQVAAKRDGMVWFGLQQYLLANPQSWVTFRRDGVVYEKATAASIAHLPQPSWLERKLLIFKTVDFDRPKVCTH